MQQTVHKKSVRISGKDIREAVSCVSDALKHFGVDVTPELLRQGKIGRRAAVRFGGREVLIVVIAHMSPKRVRIFAY